MRIHLDEVEGLGAFIEFEAPVVAGSDGTAQALVERLREACEIGEAELIAGSHVDLAWAQEMG